LQILVVPLRGIASALVGDAARISAKAQSMRGVNLVRSGDTVSVAPIAPESVEVLLDSAMLADSFVRDIQAAATVCQDMAQSAVSIEVNRQYASATTHIEAERVRLEGLVQREKDQAAGILREAKANLPSNMAALQALLNRSASLGEGQTLASSSIAGCKLVITGTMYAGVRGMRATSHTYWVPLSAASLSSGQRDEAWPYLTFSTSSDWIIERESNKNYNPPDRTMRSATLYFQNARVRDNALALAKEAQIGCSGQ